MERDNATKIITIVALLVGVVGLALGFAAFSNTLTIKSSASVTPSDTTFDVTLTDAAGTGTSVEGVATGTAGATGDTATISGDTISGLAANFTAPGQTVTYTFSAKNQGEYDAYLNKVLFNNATDHDANKKCSVDTSVAGNTVSDSLLTAACNSISIEVSVNTANFEEQNTNVSGHVLAKGTSETIVVTITYAASEDDTINRPDGQMKVEFGDIQLEYGSVD